MYIVKVINGEDLTTKVIEKEGELGRFVDVFSV